MQVNIILRWVDGEFCLPNFETALNFRHEDGNASSQLNFLKNYEEMLPHTRRELCHLIKKAMDA